MPPRRVVRKKFLIIQLLIREKPKTVPAWECALAGPDGEKMVLSSGFQGLTGTPTASIGA
jgi:hypothetical protein